MKKTFVTGLLALALTAILAGCGGSGSTSTTTTNPQPTVLKQGTYLKTGLKSSVSLAKPADAAVMTPLPQTLIVTGDGSFSFVQDDWNSIRGRMLILSDGSVTFSTDTYAISGAGVANTAPTIVAAYDNNSGILSGSTSFGAFSVTMTNLQNTVIDLTTRTGTYISTDNSMGVVSVIKVSGPGSYNISGYAFSTLADYQSGNGLYIGTFSGTIGYSDNQATTHVNALLWGMKYTNEGDTYESCTGDGYAYFDTNGNIVAVSECPATLATPTNSQFTGTWVKQ